MERIRLDALLIEHKERTGKEVLYKELAEVVFKGDKTRPLDGKRRPFDTQQRGVQLLSCWNTGSELTACKPRHLLRLSRFFKVTDITLILTD